MSRKFNTCTLLRNYLRRIQMRLTIKILAILSWEEDMKKKITKKQKQELSNKRVKMRSIDEANMKMSLKDEADSNGKNY